MAIKVFISHSSEDEALASALVDCLMAATDLTDSEIRCTSVPGHKLPVGADTATTLRDELKDVSVILGLLTRQSISSGWLLFELGAAWGARKNPKSLVSDGVAFKDLPGPLSGGHAARCSVKSDLLQVLDEIATITSCHLRSAPKVDAAIDKLLSAHREYIKATGSKGPSSVAAKLSEPKFAGVPFSELVGLLTSETVTIPAAIGDTKADSTQNLFEIFIANYKTFSDGVKSNWERSQAGGFLYYEVGLRLLPFGLVQFEKLPAAQAKYFKKLSVSRDGDAVLLHFKRLEARTTGASSSGASKKT